MKKSTLGVRRCALSAGALGALIATASSAQVTGDPTCDSGSYPLPAGGIAIEDNLDFPGGYPGDGLSGTWATPDMPLARIDRRPVHGFNLAQQSWHDATTNPLGLNPNGWDDDAQDFGNPIIISTGFVVPNSVVWLRDQLEDLYDDGWRRVVVWNPAGIIPGQEFASGQWWTLSDVKREGLEYWLKPWLDAHPEFSLGVWVGYRLTDECDLSMSGRRDPDSRDTTDMETIYRNVRPWFDQGGIDEYWFDKAFPQETAMRVINSPDLNDLKIGIETPYKETAAIPAPDVLIPKVGAERKAPWIATLLWYENIANNNPGISDGCIDNNWDVDPDTTEYGIFIRSFGDIDRYWQQLDCIECPPKGHPDYDPNCAINYFTLGFDAAVAIDPIGDYTGVTLQTLVDWRDRGFVLWTNRETWIELICLVTPKSVQSFSPAINVASLATNGELCLLDLDRDGNIGAADLAVLLASWGQTDVAPIDGDFDYDGVIGSGDLATLLASYGPCNSVTLPMLDDTCRSGPCP